jgi:hypothetical protein
MVSRFLVGAFFILACACQSAHTEKENREENKPFREAVSVGVMDKRVQEASGLTYSIQNPGMLWTHNDSGNDAEVFLVNDKAEVVMTCRLPGIKNRDWEDITIDRSPDSAKSYLFVGDIGDNRSRYPLKIIYRFEEPVFDSANKTISQFDTFYLKLEGGARDSEAMMVDPISHDLFVLSKREDSIRVFQASYPFETDTLIGHHRATLPYHEIPAAQVSADGSEILIRNYDNVYYWQRPAGTSILEVLATPPVLLTYERETQGEAACFALDGQGFYTVSESPRVFMAHLLFYKRE